MASKQNHGSDTPHGEPQQYEQDHELNRHPHRHMNFFFDSIYQVVTWVLIASAIGFLLLFFSKENWQGVLWSACVLVCLVVVMLCLLAQKHYPIFWRSQSFTLPSSSEPSPLPSPSPSPEAPKITPSPACKPPKVVGGEPSRPRPNTSPPFYPDNRWTDYTEDLFYDVVWRWFYRAPDKTPRGLTAYCPECRSENEMLFQFMVPHKLTPNMTVVPFLRMWCPLHPQHKLLPAEFNPEFDDFSEIKKLIVAKLEDGSWEEVVAAKRQGRGR